METDIPLPDELEWMEAQSLFNEEYSYLPSPYDGDGDGDVQDEDLPSPSTSPAAPDGRKRPSTLGRSDSPKRTKLGEGSCGEVELEDDDSWLRYSPRGDDDKNAEEKTEEEEDEEEVVLSRFASRIDGDCVAVTGLGGERVYAKVCRVSDEGLGSRMSYSRAKTGDSSCKINF